jgi:hypothetical protein
MPVLFAKTTTPWTMMNLGRGFPPPHPPYHLNFFNFNGDGNGELCQWR